MNMETQAAAKVLEGVWYAESAIQHSNGEVRLIDWNLIDREASQISPSDGEQFLVALAENLFRGSGEINLKAGLVGLDFANLRRIFEALRILFPSAAAEL